MNTAEILQAKDLRIQVLEEQLTACKSDRKRLKKQLKLYVVGNRLSEIEEAGKEATSLIAHLKDQHGFNDEEQASQDKIMNVFKYEGDW